MSDWSDKYSGQRVDSLSRFVELMKCITMPGSVVQSPGWAVSTLLQLDVNFAQGGDTLRTPLTEPQDNVLASVAT